MLSSIRKATQGLVIVLCASVLTLAFAWVGGVEFNYLVKAYVVLCPFLIITLVRIVG